MAMHMDKKRIEQLPRDPPVLIREFDTVETDGNLTIFNITGSEEGYVTSDVTVDLETVC